MCGICSMKTCCCCLDTGQGTALAALACVIACIIAFIFTVLGLIYWEPFTHEVRLHYKGKVSEEVVNASLEMLWWKSIFTLVVLVVYIILCVLMCLGVKKESYKLMIPWICLSAILIPIVFVSYMPAPGDIIPAIVIIACSFIWAYGLCCAMSHCRMLKGDTDQPLCPSTQRVILQRREPRDAYF